MHIFRTSYRTLYKVVNANFTYGQPSTLAKVSNNKTISFALISLPFIPTIAAQSPKSKEENHSNLKDNEHKVSKNELAILDDEKTPWERVRAIFETDERGEYSRELTTIINSSYMAMFVGAIYGGVIKSRIAFIDFMERNQGTIFDNHLDAKKKLQNHVTIHFGKGAFQWAWRLSAFTGGLMLMFFSLHAYRGKPTATDFAVSGAVIGAVMRVKLGPPGIIIGGAVGGILALFCGLANTTLLAFYGASFDDVISAQYDIDRNRTQKFDEGFTKKFEKGGSVPTVAIDMLKTHSDKPTEI